MSEGSVNPERDDKPTHGSDTDIVATVDENASDSNSVKSAALVDLHACGICYQLYNDSDRLPKVLSCGHTNCLSCLNSWQKHGSSPFPICAVCRKVTRRPIVSLPNNFQLLQVLRRMKLISTNSEPQTSAEQRKSTTQIEEMAPGITSVCEQIDEHMSEVASLLESQLDHLNSMSRNDEHPYATEFDRLLRIVESASADLISHWEVTKRHLLHTKKAKSRTSSSVPPVFSIPGLSDFFGIGRHFDEIRTDSASDDPFDRIHDFLGLDSDTPPNAYSEFSLFGSETSHETAVSASEASSQDNENYSTVIEPREESPFLHISTFDGTFGSYSYCSLCHCRLPTNTDSHRTHVLGRRHQSALGHTTDSSVTDAMRFLGLHVNRNRQPRRPRTTPLSFARRFADILHSQNRASTPLGRRDESSANSERTRSAYQSNRPFSGRRSYHRNGRNTPQESSNPRANTIDQNNTNSSVPSSRTSAGNTTEPANSYRSLPWNRGRTPERSHGEGSRDRRWDPRLASPSFGAAPSYRGGYPARRYNRATLTGRTPPPVQHGAYHMPFLVLNEPNIGFLSGTGFFAVNNSL